MWLRGFATTSCERCSTAQWAAFLLYFYFSELLILRSTALAYALWFLFCSAVASFTFYSLGFSVVVFLLFRGCCFQLRSAQAAEAVTLPGAAK